MELNRIKYDKENNAGLPDFITMTNYCESVDYEVKLRSLGIHVFADLYYAGNLIKEGTIKYKSCIDAQKQSYTNLYKHLKKH